jgi:hypothetical protein
MRKKRRREKRRRMEESRKERMNIKNKWRRKRNKR